MKSLQSIPASSDPSADHANITNQPYLMGDPAYGDFEEGDFDEMGDAPSLYGDPDPLSVFSETSGDIEEEGDLRSVLSGAVRWIKSHKKGLLIGAGAALTTAGLAKIIAHKRKEAARKAAIRKSIAQQQFNQTVRKTALVQQSVGKLSRDSLMRFFSLKGAKMNSSPIDPLSTFVTDMFKNMLDRQAMDTPFYQETAIGAFAGGTWTATAVGVVASRFYTSLILQIGTNILNASPGTVINVTGTFPTIQGNLVVAANPFLLTYEKSYDVRFLFFPWQLISNKPLPVLGQYSNASPIIATVTGIPSASAVNLIVPGSIHPYTVAMRNALIK